ncbi:MAG: glycoside hydrolase family 78 protein [Alphaproteobacteria bacterium]
MKELRCEYRANPLGIDVVEPRLSWVPQSAERGQRQTAYRVLAASSPEKLTSDEGDLWDSGKVESDQTIHLAYEGKPLTSRMRCWWKVRIWNGDGEASAWSEPAMWSMGLLKPGDWKAQWIANAKDDPASEAGPMPAAMVRKSFVVDGPIKRATVYVTGLGLYELHLNGPRVGDHLLAPEFTVYDRRIQYQTFDVTDLVVAGENAVGAILGDGWHGEYFFGMPMRQAQRPFGGRRGFIMRLDIEQVDGTTQIIVTDKSWRSTREGPIRSASLYDGEVYDARMEMPGWDRPGFDDSLWNQTVTADYLACANLVWQRNEPIRVVKELKPVKMTEPKPGIYVFDLGQNMVGWCRLKVHGRAGTTVKLRHAEMLNDDGAIYTANLRGAAQTDIYIKHTDGEEIYEPRFTYHGFRYVELTGAEYKPYRYMPPYKPKADDLSGRVFHSASPDAGHFQCSSDLINKIMHMIVWVQRGNMHGIPTDCPQRDERAGWMGDIQSFSQTAIFNMDMASFFSKWLTDVRDSQAEDGRYPNFAPMDHNRWKGGTPAWADAGTIVPWRMYQNYGDIRMIEEHYESARRWVDYVRGKNPNLLWDKNRGDSFNDWLNGDTLVKEGWPKTGGRVPPQVLATAFFAHSTEIVGKMAAVIGRTDDAKKYSRLSEGIKAAFNEKYVQPDGRIEGNTQAGYALALRFNLLPVELRPQAARHMVEEFKRYNGHMSTGIQTSHRLMLELTRGGYNNEAYRLLNLRTCPSWGFMAEQGATTIWERWDGYIQGRGFQKPMMNSLNHWALGSVGEWIWRNVVGLNPDDNKPGWKHFIIAPRPGGGVTWARGQYNSIRGTIICDWRLEKDNFRLDVTVPANTTATVYLPANDAGSVAIDGQTAADSRSVHFLGIKNGKAAFAVNSGRYQFVSRSQTVNGEP